MPTGGKTPLNNAQQSVVLDGSTSSAKPISAGVPQGSILGPLLFLMFNDELALHLENDIHLFADDFTLHIAFKNTCDRIICAESLQCNLNKKPESSPTQLYEQGITAYI